MKQSSETQSRLVSLGERLTALDNRVNEFIPDINTKIDNLALENKSMSKEICNLALQTALDNKNLVLQIQPLAAENKNLSERMDNMAAENKNISKEIHNLERQMSAENKNLERQMSADIKNLERQMAAGNKNLSERMDKFVLQIQPLVDDRLNAKKIRTIVIGGAIVAVSGALASGLFATF